MRQMTQVLVLLFMTTALSSVSCVSGVSAQELSDAEIEALHQALQDEYKAKARYENVIDDFGEVRPFSNIVHAEQRHIDALIGLYEKYGVPVVKNVWADYVVNYDSVGEACRAGVEAEISNADLYDTLMAGIEHEDIQQVFRNLQRASRERHLRAFQRCAGRRR